MNHVLVVDDEPAIVEIVRDYLADAGYRVSTAHSGDEALRQVRSIRPDLIVLDLGLPGLDGLDVARTIRQSSRVPIIMLTARSDEADRVVGLGARRRRLPRQAVQSPRAAGQGAGRAAAQRRGRRARRRAPARRRRADRRSRCAGSSPSAAGRST